MTWNERLVPRSRRIQFKSPPVLAIKKVKLYVFNSFYDNRDLIISYRWPSNFLIPLTHWTDRTLIFF